MELSNDTILMIKQHAIAQYPKECCGVIVDNQYIPMRNVHEDALHNFRIDDAEFNPYFMDGLVQAVIHSHTGVSNNYPSKMDMIAQDNMALPWGIVHIDVNHNIEGPFFFGDQADISPLEGRPFKHAVWDCYTLLRDKYRLEKDVTLPLFPREYEWWNKGEDMLGKGFKEAGFKRISREELRPDDVVLCNVGSSHKNSVVNHVGIVVGKGLILHHLRDRVSRRDPINRWMSTVELCLRYAPDET